MDGSETGERGRLLLLRLIPLILLSSLGGLAWVYSPAEESVAHIQILTETPVLMESDKSAPDTLAEVAADDPGDSDLTDPAERADTAPVWRLYLSPEEELEIKTRRNTECFKRVPRAYRDIIRENAERYGLEPSLVTAVITVESSWDPNALSHRGAMGLMQLMPDTARDMGVDDPFDPGENIRGGTKYLKYLMKRFDGNHVHAVAAYNAGLTRVRAHQGIPPIRETRNYVKRVFSLYIGGRESEAI